jgi:hypothetical protein
MHSEILQLETQLSISKQTINDLERKLRSNLSCNLEEKNKYNDYWEKRCRLLEENEKKINQQER